MAYIHQKHTNIWRLWSAISGLLHMLAHLISITTLTLVPLNVCSMMNHSANFWVYNNENEGILPLNQGHVYIIDLCTKCYESPEKEDVTLKGSKNSSCDSRHLFHAYIHSLKAHHEPDTVLGPRDMVDS